MPRFITNQEVLLSELLNNTIPQCKQLDFLIGYFYFSGFDGIYKEIKDKPLRILVGMEANVTVHNAIREWVETKNNTALSGQSIQKIQKSYFENSKNIINKADIVDTKDGEESFKCFIEKLNYGTLEVRKTKDPAHAKMYIFVNADTHSEGGTYPGKAIVGSSNLSFHGLQGRTEINATFRDPNDFNEATQIFNKLWDEAIPLVDQSTKEDFFETVIKHTWLEKIPSPYLMYIRVLHEYFNKETETIKTPAGLTHTGDNEYMNLTYQTDAISEGLEKIKKHSGCIVADVVGLGKSIIGVTIAANLNIPTIIICPPHLKAQWDDFAIDFGLNRYHVVSSGKIEDAFELSERIHGEKLIIIDEAHRYRNEDTLDYGLLHKTCIGNKVLLLSATPFNNRPQDIFSLIKLFQIPTHSTIQTFNNLSAKMETLILDHKKLKRDYANNMSEPVFKTKAKEISSQIRDMLDPVLIRRTRVDLIENTKYKDDLEKQNIVFSDVEPPEEQEYDLGTMSELYLETLNQLSGVVDKDAQVFIGARYQPLTYLKDDKKILDKYRVIFDNPNPQEGQKNMAVFMKRLVVRRFESSIYSFKKTLQNIIASMHSIKNWHTNFKKIPLYKKSNLPDFESLEEMINEELDSTPLFDDIDEILQYKLSPQIEKGLILVNADELKDDFIKDLDKDILLFETILAKWNSDDFNFDPKFDGILLKIEESLSKEKNRKIIVFSEFKDTVDYLEEKFKEKNVRVIKYSSKTKYSKNIIKQEFDAGLAEIKQTDNYDVLVATDAISEGFSLHRAGTIYNYDIPYNPTRVIQRVGRINRVNKKVFDKLNIYNFFPTATGEAIGRTKSIATFKMLLIQTIFGSDTKILTNDEIVEGYLTEQYKKAKLEEEVPSWRTIFENELYHIKRTNKEAYKKALELPQRCRTGRKIDFSKTHIEENELFSESSQKGVIVFSKKGDALRFSFCDENGKSITVKPDTGITLFKALPDEKALPVTESYYPLYEKAKTHSGSVKESSTRSKNTMDLVNKINFLKSDLRKLPDTKNDITYLDSLFKICSALDSLPLYYTRRLLDVEVKDSKDMVNEFKELVPESYLNTIIEKDNQILNEVETVLLSEQFL